MGARVSSRSNVVFIRPTGRSAAAAAGSSGPNPALSNRVVPAGTAVRGFATGAAGPSGFKHVATGDPGSKDYRIWIENAQGAKVSSWYNVPLQPRAGLYNMIVEIPRGERAKMELDTDHGPYHPIKQDVNKKGATLRYYHYPSLVNYGALPQTWEDPEHCFEGLDLYGDGDPLDVCDISSIVPVAGQVYPVKVLGVLAMIDEGEMDWKLIAINAADPRADSLTDITSPSTPKDVRDQVDEIRHWFEVYKMPDGKPRNKFAFDGQPQSAEFAINIINETHQAFIQRLAKMAMKH